MSLDEILKMYFNIFKKIILKYEKVILNCKISQFEETDVEKVYFL